MNALADQMNNIGSVNKLLNFIQTDMAEMRATLQALPEFVSEVDKVATHVKEIRSNTQSLKDAEYTQKLLAWLSPLEPQKRHQAVKAQRVENTGIWILLNQQFQSWLKGDLQMHSGGASEQVLACYGEPGVGKTFIA
ncbi:hypothetical protein BDZ91DRAFT_330764 [Kalaharituber pfeilii]|nr:hypothetical protein BDZ91DRAFT_330764 [Kalaharituber pfeilii]